jgi:hypothetical protein
MKRGGDVKCKDVSPAFGVAQRGALPQKTMGVRERSNTSP